MIDCYPWLKQDYNDLLANFSNGSLPHALLLYGDTGNGAELLASALAQAMLCQNKSDLPCQACPACRLLANNTHPDLVQVGSEDGASIGIEAVRSLTGVIEQTANLGGGRVIIINSVERMNIYATNAILKILEEPPAGVYFILTCHQLKQVLPTIRSRVQQHFVLKPDAQMIKQFMEKQGKSPSLVLIKQCQCCYDRVAKALDNEDYLEAINQFNRTLLDVITGKKIATSLSQCIDDKYISNMFDFVIYLIEDLIKRSVGLACANESDDMISSRLRDGDYKQKLFSL